CSFFFFSSRRRHTRSDRDWSSDVCSSDLDRGPPFHPPDLSDLEVPNVLLSHCELFGRLLRGLGGLWLAAVATAEQGCAGEDKEDSEWEPLEGRGANEGEGRCL